MVFSHLNKQLKQQQ